MGRLLPADFELERYGIHVRLVSEADSPFILTLRTDEKLGRFIHATSPDVQQQIEWTRKYKEREKQGEDYYFVFEKPKGNPLGVCRIYDINNDNFTIGSWLFKKDAPVGAAILGDIITREIAFSLFPHSILNFDVRKANLNVNRYQATYKPQIVREDELSYYYTCSKENFEKYKKLHLRMFSPK